MRVAAEARGEMGPGRGRCSGTGTVGPGSPRRRARSAPGGRGARWRRRRASLVRGQVPPVWRTRAGGPGPPSLWGARQGSRSHAVGPETGSVRSAGGRGGRWGRVTASKRALRGPEAADAAMRVGLRAVGPPPAHGARTAAAAAPATPSPTATHRATGGAWPASAPASVVSASVRGVTGNPPRAMTARVPHAVLHTVATPTNQFFGPLWRVRTAEQK